MRLPLIPVLLLASLAQGQDTPPAGMREKIRARIIETLPPPSPRQPEAPSREGPVLVLKKMVISEDRAVRELEKALADDRRRKEAAHFTATRGGTLYRSERLEVGSWWSPTTGWQFLKFKW